jgi:hypothetical protein
MVGRVNYYWRSPTQSFLVPSYAGLMTILLTDFSFFNEIKTGLMQSPCFCGREAHHKLSSGQTNLHTSWYLCLSEWRGTQISLASDSVVTLPRQRIYTRGGGIPTIDVRMQIVPCAVLLTRSVNAQLASCGALDVTGQRLIAMAGRLTVSCNVTST